MNPFCYREKVRSGVFSSFKLVSAKGRDFIFWICWTSCSVNVYVAVYLCLISCVSHFFYFFLEAFPFLSPLPLWWGEGVAVIQWKVLHTCFIWWYHMRSECTRDGSQLVIFMPTSSRLQNCYLLNLLVYLPGMVSFIYQGWLSYWCQQRLSFKIVLAQLALMLCISFISRVYVLFLRNLWHLIWGVCVGGTANLPMLIPFYVQIVCPIISNCSVAYNWSRRRWSWSKNR